MTLAEALALVGVPTESWGETTVPTAPRMGVDQWGVEVEREILWARVEGKAVLVLPLCVYVTGEVAEEWVVSAGGPPSLPRTIFRMRAPTPDGEWVFQGPRRDPADRKGSVLALRSGV